MVSKHAANRSALASSKPSILVVEAEGAGGPDVRQTLTDLGYRVTAAASTAPAALAAMERDAPDLAVVDSRLEGAMDGIDLAGQLRLRHSVPVLLLGAQTDPEAVARLKLILPHGYLATPFDEGQLRVAVELALHRAGLERAQRREMVADRAKLNELEARAAMLEEQLRQVAGLVSGVGAGGGPVDPGLGDGLARLSRREEEILRLLAEARRVAAISRQLGLSTHTVRNHLRAIFRKLGVHSQEELLDAIRGLPAVPRLGPR